MSYRFSRFIVCRQIVSKSYGRGEIELVEAFSLRNDTGETEGVRRSEVVIGEGMEGRKTKRKVY